MMRSGGDLAFGLSIPNRVREAGPPGKGRELVDGTDDQRRRGLVDLLVDHLDRQAEVG